MANGHKYINVTEIKIKRYEMKVYAFIVCRTYSVYMQSVATIK